MLKPLKYLISLFTIILLLTSLAVGLILIERDWSHQVVRTTEKELKVNIESAFGKIYVSRGDPSEIYKIDIKQKEGKKAKGRVHYDLKGNVGILDLELGKTGRSDFDSGEGDRFSLGGFETGAWYVRLTDAIPITFNIELGLGKGDFDCSGLMVKDFKLSTGASSVVLRFREPNRTVIENLRIESGISRFVGESLGNANFRRLDFSGGVGSYTLDLTGNLRHEADVKVEVGVGAITIIVPKNVGARIESEESWFSKINLDRDFHKKRSGEYVTENYATASPRLNISVESALGHVRVRRGEE